MNKTFKKVMVSGLTMAMVFGGSTAAFADSKGKGQGNGNKVKQQKSWESYKVWDNKKNVWNIKSDNNTSSTNNNDININIKLTFDDVKGSDVEWAMRYIASLASKGVFEGYEDGTFQPRRTITRIEAITAAVRLMGLKDEAESADAKNTNLNFKDADKIKSKYPWAVGYVAVALKNDLFEESDDSVQPEKEADRLWATTLLVKAMKLQDEAKTKMNTKLTFKDANKIPAGSVGYVEEAIEKHLVDGYEDNTFRPDRSVTRAELAALLDRTGNQLPDNTSIVGATLSSSVSNNTVALTKDGQSYTIELDSSAFIFRNGAKVSASELKSGDVATIRTFNGKAYYIEVTTLADGEQQQRDFTSATLTSSVNNNVIYFTKDNQSYSYTLDSNVTILRNGARANASDLRNGDIVTVRTANGKAYYVEVTTAVDANQARDFSGATLTSSVNNNVIYFTKDNQSYSYTLDSNVTILRNNTRVNASDLKNGDVVTVRTANGKAFYVEVTTAVDANQARDFSGATLTSTTNNNVIYFSKDNQSYSYTLDSNVTIIRNNTRVNASDLRSGDVVTVRTANGKAFYVEVTTAVDANQQNDFTGATLTSYVNNNVLYFTKDNNNYSYTLDSGATIVRNGSVVNASQLRNGDVVNVRISNSRVYFVEVTSAASDNQDYNFSVLGTFNSYTLNSNGKIATISINQNLNNTVQTAVYNTSSDLTIQGNLSDLTANRNIELRGEDQLVNTIIIR